jgi:uncharacterized phage infection (PIP) family protein YhgE
MKYTEVLEHIKTAGQAKQAGLWGDLGGFLHRLWSPMSSAAKKVEAPRAGIMDNIKAKGTEIRAAAADAAQKAKHNRYLNNKAGKKARHAQDLYNGQREVSKNLQNKLTESRNAYSALRDRYDESQAFNHVLRNNRTSWKDRMNQAMQEIDAQKKLNKKQQANIQNLQGQLQQSNELSEARLQGLNAYKQQAEEQLARGNKWRSRAWKTGLGTTAVVGSGAYALGRMNGAEGAPQPAQDYLRDANGNLVYGPDGQPILAPRPGQVAAPGTYEAWLNSRR